MSNAVSPYQSLHGMLERNTAQLHAALPAHIDVNRFIRTVMTYARKNPALLECTPDSLAKAIMDSAQLGLAPDGLLGSGYIVPYKTKKDPITVTATFIPGYRGLIDLARRTGVVSRMESRLVRQGDIFEVEYGTEPFINHQPRLVADVEAGEVVAAYAVAWHTDGGVQFEVMTRQELEHIRSTSPGSRRSDSPWNIHPGEMYRKCPIRRLCKYLPLSPELAQAIRHDIEAEMSMPASENDAPPPTGLLAFEEAVEAFESTVEARDPGEEG